MKYQSFDSAASRVGYKATMKDHHVKTCATLSSGAYSSLREEIRRLNGSDYMTEFSIERR